MTGFPRVESFFSKKMKLLEAEALTRNMKKHVATHPIVVTWRVYAHKLETVIVGQGSDWRSCITLSLRKWVVWVGNPEKWTRLSKKKVCLSVWDKQNGIRKFLLVNVSSLADKYAMHLFDEYDYELQQEFIA